MPSARARQFGRGPIPDPSRQPAIRSRIAAICSVLSTAVFFSGIGSRCTSRTGLCAIASSRTANPHTRLSTDRARRAADGDSSVLRRCRTRSHRPAVKCRSSTPPHAGRSVSRTVVSYDSYVENDNPPASARARTVGNHAAQASSMVDSGVSVLAPPVESCATLRSRASRASCSLSPTACTWCEFPASSRTRARARYLPEASRATWTAPSAPAGFLGLAMTTLPRPRHHVRHVLAHMPAQPHERRTVAGQPPVLHSALGHPEHLGDLMLGQEPRQFGSQRIHTREVRAPSRRYPAPARTNQPQPVEHGHESRPRRVYADVSADIDPKTGCQQATARRILPRNDADRMAGVPGLEPRTIEGHLARPSEAPNR
jgi:hypothetical protein